MGGTRHTEDLLDVSESVRRERAHSQQPFVELD
jgi:hypothetical protein